MSPPGRPLRVLIAEDQPDDVELLLRELRRGGFQPEPRRVQAAAAMAEALADGSWDLVISDYSMPEFDAPAALRLVQERGLDVPFIIVSGTIGEDTAVAAMKAGAHDYLTKGQLKRLVPAVERELREAAARKESRRAEAALRLSDERARLVGQVTNDLIWDWNVRTGALWLGDAVRRTWGWDVEHVTISWWFERIHPDDVERVRAGLHDAVRGDRATWWDEYRFRRADGSHAVVLDRGQVLRDPTGAAERMIGSIVDLSERLHMEETLRASEERFRTLVTSLDDLVFTLGPDQRVTEVFGRYLVRTGGKAEELVGRAVASLFDLEGEEGALEEACRKALAGAPARFEGASGDRARHVSIALSPLHDAAGRVTGAVGLARDVSEHRRVQEALVLSDRMVSVGTLAAGVAHEINNPLAAVVVNLDYITRVLAEARSADDAAAAAPVAERHLAARARLAEVREPLHEARLAIDRVRQIVRDLKIFSRTEPTEEQTGPVDVERVLDSSVRMAWNEIRHRARLIKEYAGLPPVAGSESRLGQVFLNLIVNAAQAICEGQVDRNRITITTKLGAGTITVEVADTGAGMPPEVLRKLFTPFFTTKPVGTGTGLGLSICHRIVTGIGGSIGVESQVGKGTTFRVVLPVGDLKAHPARPVAAPSAAPPRSRRGVVLVIDDEPFVANAIVRSLTREHDVAILGRATEALAGILAGDRYDVILCDLMMPEMTGMDLYDELRRAVPAQAERMIFMTGGAFTQRARAFLENVPNQRLEKPFDQQVLLGLIGERVR